MLSRPWAVLHSSPGSPRHVPVNCQHMQILVDIAIGKHTKNGQAHLSTRVDVGVEASSTSVGGDCLDTRSRVRVVVSALDLQFEETEFVRGV